MDTFTENIKLLKLRFSKLAEKLENINIDSINVKPTRDNGYYFEMIGSSGKAIATESPSASPGPGAGVPLTNPMTPLKEAQNAIKKMEHRLTRGFNPAVIVGLRHGFDLDMIFYYSKDREDNHHEPFRRIYVIVDSLLCLVGWLKAGDRTEILQKDMVEFCENAQYIVDQCENDDSRSHAFIPVSVLPENEMNTMIKPLAALFHKREEETKRWIKENNEYYDNLDDETLAAIIGQDLETVMKSH